jgi:hypothetical protein
MDLLQQEQEKTGAELAETMEIRKIDEELKSINKELEIARPMPVPRPLAGGEGERPRVLVILAVMLLLAVALMFTYSRISGFSVLEGNETQNLTVNETMNGSVTEILPNETIVNESFATNETWNVSEAEANTPVMAPQIKIRDRKGNWLLYQSDSAPETEDSYTVTITPPLKAVKRVRLHGVRSAAAVDVGLEELPVEGTGWEQMYAIDLSNSNFSNGTLTAVALGSELYKCKEWNFTEQQCHGEWTKVMDLVPGEEYSIELTPVDPAYSETRQPSQNDSYVDQQNPNTNYGTSTEIDVQARNNRARRAFVRFNITGIPSNAVVTSANISLYKYGGSTSSRTYNAYRVTANWAESTVTWNNQPGVAASPSSSTTVSSTGVWYVWNVTNDTQNIINGTYTNYGWRISDSSEGGGGTITSQFYSKEYMINTSRRPKLDISYIVDTVPNTTLVSPPNGNITAIKDVNFTCNATDDFNLSNMTFYWNYTGSWLANGTIGITGTKNQTSFIRNNLSNVNITWNCLACDKANRCNFSATNWSVRVNYTPPDLNPWVNASFPVNNSLDADGNVTFNCSASDDNALANISLFINNSLNRTKAVSGSYNYSEFNLALANGTYTWYCYAKDSAGNTNTTGNYTLTVNTSATPNSTSFSGATTNWSVVPDLTNVCGGAAVLDLPGNGSIRWWGCVNASYQNFDANVNISPNLVYLNSSSLSQTFNSTATITLTNLPWDSLPEILLDGAICDPAVCQNATYNDTTGTLVFNTTHFTNFSTVGNSRLRIWDQNDSGQPKGNRPACQGQRTEFFANYSRTSNSNPITAATCIINFTDSTGNAMTYNATSLYYEYNRTFSTPGIKQYNASCQRTGFQRISLSDTINITDCTPPSVTLISPSDGNTTAKRDFNFTCNATENINLTNITFYWNYTGSWQANGTVNATGNTNSTYFNRTNLTISRIAWNCQACDNSSLCAYAPSNFTLNITSFPPQVNITSPANSSIFNQGADIPFKGQAYDEHDGNLTGTSLVWTSSIDGRIGTGTAISFATLTPGNHNITLNAKNSDGLSSSTTITVTVIADNCPGTEANAFTLVNITIDGNMTDWDPVLENTYNYITDGAGGINDPDNVTSVELDLRKYSVTWNNETLWMHVRRNGLGQTLMKTAVYLDVNENALLDAPDTVAFFPWYGPWGLYLVFAYNYTPVNTTGDNITGDGQTEPGGRTAGRLVTLGIGGADNGIELEASVSWASLNLPACSPLVGHVSSTQGLISNIPSDVIDNMRMLDTRLYRIKFYPDSIKSSMPGTSVIHIHTIRNIGNVKDLYNLNITGTLPGYTAIPYFINGTPLSDTDSDGRPDTGYILPSYGATIYLNVTIPPSAPIGETDVTQITAVSKRKNSENASVIDTTIVARVSVIPNNQGLATNTTTMEYNHTVYNNDLPSPININASSTSGYTVTLHHANGTLLTDTNGDSIPDIGTLPTGESRIIKVRIVVPPSATIGHIDNTTVQATSVYGQYGRAYDATTIARPLTIIPNITKAVGQGKSTYLIHNITYVSNASGVVDITFNRTQLYTLQLYASDLTTLLTDTNSNGIIDAGTFGPNGHTKMIAAKLTVPESTPINTTDIIFYNISSPPLTPNSTAKDNVTVQKLVTYLDSGFTLQSYQFRQTERVYAEGYSLTAANVYFQYIDPNATVARLSPAVLVDSSRRADDYYTTNTSDLSGQWTLVLYDTNGTVEITRIQFNLNTPPVIISANATPNQAYQGDPVNFTANITAGEQRWLNNETVVMGALFEIAGINYSMTGPNTTSGIGNYYIDTLNTTNITPGVHNYKIWAYDNFTFNNVSLPYPGTLTIYSSNSTNVTGLLTDSNNNTVTAMMYIHNSTGHLVWTDDQNYSFVLDRSDRYNVTILPATGVLKSLIFINVTFPPVLINFTRLEDSPETYESPYESDWLQAIAWAPKAGFSYGAVRINFSYGTGQNLSFWKCPTWDFDLRTCTGDTWNATQDIPDGPGSVTIQLSAGDPVGGAAWRPDYNETLWVYDVTGLNDTARRDNGTLIGKYNNLEGVNFTLAKSYRIETHVEQIEYPAVGRLFTPRYNNIQDDWAIDTTGIDAPNITTVNGTVTINPFTIVVDAGTEPGTNRIRWDSVSPGAVVLDLDQNDTVKFWYVVDIPANASGESHNGRFFALGLARSATIQNNLTTVFGSVPCTVNLTFPNNGNNTLIERIFTFLWQQACDPDNQTLTYSINISSSICPNIYDTNISVTNYTPIYELGTYDECGAYNWTVRAYDGYYYGNWSDSWNFSIMPYVALFFINDTVDFGTADNDITNDTTTENPQPFLMQSDGNVFTNVVNVTANQSFFIGSSATQSDFQIKVRNSTELNSFNWTGSATNWINLTTIQRIIDRFNWHEANDTAKIDVKVHVPIDEPSGVKIVGLVFYGEQS